jgi:hypothetical protein
VYLAGEAASPRRLLLRLAGWPDSGLACCPCRSTLRRGFVFVTAPFAHYLRRRKYRRLPRSAARSSRPCPGTTDGLPRSGIGRQRRFSVGRRDRCRFPNPMTGLRVGAERERAVAFDRAVTVDDIDDVGGDDVAARHPRDFSRTLRSALARPDDEKMTWLVTKGKDILLNHGRRVLAAHIAAVVRGGSSENEQ